MTNIKCFIKHSTRNKFSSQKKGAQSSTIKKFPQFSKISADNVRVSAPFSMSARQVQGKFMARSRRV